MTRANLGRLERGKECTGEGTFAAACRHWFEKSSPSRSKHMLKAARMDRNYQKDGLCAWFVCAVEPSKNLLCLQFAGKDEYHIHAPVRFNVPVAYSVATPIPSCIGPDAVFPSRVSLLRGRASLRDESYF